MPRRASCPLFWLTLACAVFFSGSAAAWVETAVRGHAARIEVHKDGSAIVRHELLLKVRGGPMKSVEIGGIGTIGDPLPDATVKMAEEGTSRLWPLSVSSLEDGSLRLAISDERGIRGGSYLFTFAYLADLKALGHIKALDDGIEISFFGPRLATGVDSAKVTFVLPRGSTPPALGVGEEGSSGVLLGEVRRGADSDEIDLVRAHLAILEPAVWKVIVAPDALASSVTQSEGEAPITSASIPASGQRRALSRLGIAYTFLPLGVFLGMLFGSLVFFKARFVGRAARAVDARVKPLLPGPPWVRALIVGASVLTATFLVLRHEPWWAMLALSAGCAASTYLLPVRTVRPRGPGTWEQIELSAKAITPDLPGKMFETRSVVGFLFLGALVVSIVTVAYRILPESNYFALMMLSLVLLLVPLFWTGRLLDLPQSPSEQARPWIRFLGRAIDNQVASVELWGRRSGVFGATLESPGPREVYDETRIRVLLHAPPVGLRALEVSFDEAAGAFILPCVVVRVLQDSPAEAALPADVPWQRGRAPEEKVAVLRPSAPTTAQLLRLLKTLTNNLRAAARYSRSAPSSKGRADSTSKGGTPATAHAR